MPSAALMFVRTVVVRDWRFLSVTLMSCAVAAIVAMFQYSVYTSFVRAAGVVPGVLGGNFWVSAASVECFDFPTPFNEDYGPTLTRYVPNAHFRRVVFGFATWRSPLGKRGNVAVVGVDGTNLPDDGFIADRSDLQRLDLSDSTNASLQMASISDSTVHLDHTVTNLTTFLGAPYVVVSFERGRELLHLDPNSTSFLIGDTGGMPSNFEHLRAAAHAAFPEVELIAAHDFQSSSAHYWERKTGAGIAILLAAVLAGLLMAILQTNGVLRFIQRYHQDLVSLLGHGADRRDVTLIVSGIAALVALVTMVSALLITPVVVAVFRPLLPWIAFSLYDALIPISGIVISLAIALFVSRRAILTFAPDVVFRS